MKKHVFQKLVATTVAMLTFAALSACGAQTTPNAASDIEQDKTTIGILQYAEHPSLDNCREGFVQGMEAAGYVTGENVEYLYQNAQADPAVAQQIAQGFVSQKVDMIVAVATPAAQAAYNAAEPAGIPTVYVAVADPVAAGLVGEDKVSGKLVTGTSDLVPAAAQLELIRAFLPDAKKIGILYSTGEINSESQLALYEQAAPALGFEIVAAGVSSSADVALAGDTLLSKVDCLNNLTDNLVVTMLPTILDKANTANIPVFGSEIEQVKNGCIASSGIEYVALGAQSGALAARVLRGEDITAIPYEVIAAFRTDVNVTAMDRLGIALPAGLETGATLHT